MRTAQAGLISVLAHPLYRFASQCRCGLEPYPGTWPASALLQTGGAGVQRASPA